MSITHKSVPPVEATESVQPATGDLSLRAAGAGAITFALVVVVQNLIRGASAPAMDAGGSKILTHYAGHGATTFVLAATYVITGIGMALFLGGASRRLLSSGRPGWAVTGIVGAVSIMGLFAIVVGAEQAIGVVANQAHPNLGAIEALWALHNSVFTVLDFSIAVALIGLSRAGIAAGLTPGVFARLAPVGAALLLVGTLTGPATASGDTMAFFAITVVGFLVWLSFLVATGLRLVRELV
jgi:hypothetical protein